MKRLVIIAHGISPLGTMGGNSKIIIEILKNLPKEIPAIVVTMKPESFSGNGVRGNNVTIIPIPKPSKDDWLHMPITTLHTMKYTRDVFAKLGIGPGDVVYCVSDFPLDVLPGYVLKKKFGYTWMPSFFLFVPSPLRNITSHYGFPFFKYLAYYFEQRVIFAMMKRRANGFVITNDSDRTEFPLRFSEKVLAIYGGVNVEQIIAADKPENRRIMYDAVFCSRLHPQKGIDRLLDIWSLVVKRVPSAKLAVIGNGEAEYEKRLREKAVWLGIDRNIEWLGYVNNEAKYAVYFSSMMLLHATVYDNNGMVAAEALCTGLPVVMYDLSALRKVYIDGCCKVKEGDMVEFADTVVRIIKEPTYRSSVIADKQVIDKLRKEWAWETKTAEFIEFIRTVI